MSISDEPYGTLPDGRVAQLFDLTNANGLAAKITNYGGTVTELHVPDREGTFADVVLGKPTLEGYLAGHPNFGAITGRVAGRIGGASFSIDGEHYELEANNGPNCLHGGAIGYDKLLWNAEIVTVDGLEKLRLSATDPAGSNGFPGTIHCVVTYALTADNALEITYEARTDHVTPFNVTNHSYFNLAGHASGDVLGHELQILADAVAAVDENSTLVGRKDPVVGDFNDYREPVTLRDRDELVVGNADIHFFHAHGRTAGTKLIAKVYEPNSGRIMEVHTTEPGVQFYAGLSLSEDGPESGKEGAVYGPANALCLETQDYADSVHYPEMGGAILRPGETFTSTTLYRFDLAD